MCASVYSTNWSRVAVSTEGAIFRGEICFYNERLPEIYTHKQKDENEIIRLHFLFFNEIANIFRTQSDIEKSLVFSPQKMNKPV